MLIPINECSDEELQHYAYSKDPRIEQKYKDWAYAEIQKRALDYEEFMISANKVIEDNNKNSI